MSAHCHPVSAIRRSIEFGVRCIEHGTLIDADTAQFVAERGSYVVPTMSVIFVTMEIGAKLGMTPDSMTKLKVAADAAIEGLQHMRDAELDAILRHQAADVLVLKFHLAAPHLATLGAEPWPRPRFLATVAELCAQPGRPGPWTEAFGVVPAAALG